MERNKRMGESFNYTFRVCLFGWEIGWMENFGKKMGRETVLECVWLGGEDKTKWWDPCVFLLAHQKVLFKIERKLKREIGYHFWTKMPMYNCTFTYVAFFHIFFSFFFSYVTYLFFFYNFFMNMIFIF